MKLDELDLHITNRCTTSCKYCCFSSNRMILPELTTDEFKKILLEAAELGCTHVHFTGGEPLLRKDIISLIEYAKDLNMHMRMQTNGMLLTPNVARQLRYAGLTSIMISLDSDRPDEHDIMRGDGTWEKAVNAIKVAQDEGMNVRVNSVITLHNWKRIIRTIQFVHELHINRYSAFYFSPIGCGSTLQDSWIDPETYLQYWKNLTDELCSNATFSDMDIVIEKGYADWQEAKTIDIRGFTGCGGGCQHSYANRQYLIVRCDGNVYPCIMGIDCPPLGNLHQNTLQSILECNENWEILKPQNDPYCSNCTHYILCGEGCRFYPQDSFGHDIRCKKGNIVPLCPIMKYNFRNNSIGGSSDDVMRPEKYS